MDEANFAIGSRQLLIDRLCDDFELQWKAGSRPTLETFLANWNDIDVIEVVFQELLRVELELLSKSASPPRIEDYVKRFPDREEVIQKVFASQVQTIVRPDNSATSIQDETQPAASESQRTDIAIPGFTISEELGRGGMGVVYRARQDALNRVVAIKTIRTGSLAATEEVDRFVAEAESAARLDHPNIVPIHEIGELEGLHYFSMGFVKGHSLRQKLNEGVFSPRDAASLMKTLAEATQYAHANGIIHRDLKPANILIDQNGQPRITDFGLAKQIETDSSLTATGQILGTPNFMPPEQATGATGKIGPHSDVYSMGAILYMLVTGRPPFQSDNALETLKQVVEHDPTSPRVLNPSVDRDLETICLKCLEKVPERRYCTARELAHDLQLYLDGRTISARPVSRVQRARRWCKRNPLLSTVICLILAIAIGGPVVAANQMYLADQANREKERADDTVVELKESLENETQAKNLAMRSLAYLTNALKSPDPANSGNNVTVSEVLEHAEKQVAKDFRDDPLGRAEILNAIGEGYYGIGRFGDAARVHEQAMTAQAKELGDHDPRALESMHALGAAYLRASLLVKALPVCKEVFETRQRTLGKTHSDTLKSMNNLARCLQEAGQLKKALEIFKETLDARKQTLGETHRDSLNSLSNLAGIKSQLGERSDALKMKQTVLRLAKKHLGVDHPDTMRYTNNLAGAYQLSSRHQQALTMFEDNYQRMIAKYDPNHLEALNALGNLAIAHCNAGQTERGHNLLNKAVNGLRTNYGDRHAITMQWMTNAAKTLQDKGSDIQIKTLNRLLSLRRQILGSAHRDTQDTLRTLHGIYRDTGRWDESLALFESTLQYRTQRYGVIDLMTIRAMNDVGLAYKRRGKSRTAIAIFEEAIKKHQNSKHDDHEVVLDLMNNLAGAYHEVHEIKRSVTLYEQTLKQKRSVLGDDHPSTLIAMNNLAIEYESAGRQDEALALYEQSLALKRKNLGIAHHSTLLAMYNLGSVYRERSRLDKAESIINECLQIREKHRPNEWWTFQMYAERGIFLHLKKQSVEAEEQMLKGFRGLLGRLPIIPPHERHRVFDALKNLVAMYRLNGKPADVVPHISSALESVKQQRRLDSRTRNLTMKQLLSIRAEMYDRLGRYEPAIADWRAVLALETGPDRITVARQLADDLARHGHYSEATQRAKELIDIAQSPQQLYLLARIYSLSSIAAGRDHSLTIPLRRQRVDKFSAQAVTLLEKAYADPRFRTQRARHLLSADSELDPLRNRRDFQRLCDDLGVRSHVVAIKPRENRRMLPAMAIKPKSHTP